MRISFHCPRCDGMTLAIRTTTMTRSIEIVTTPIVGINEMGLGSYLATGDSTIRRFEEDKENAKFHERIVLDCKECGSRALDIDVNGMTKRVDLVCEKCDLEVLEDYHDADSLRDADGVEIHEE